MKSIMDVTAVQDRAEIRQDHVVGLSGRRELVGAPALLAFLANPLHGLERFAFGRLRRVLGDRRQEPAAVHTFCPFTTKWSPSSTARVRRLARSPPASGSE
jgi:hypothetical protein